MYLAISYGFVAFTVLLFTGLLWLGWENRREEAKRASKTPPNISN